MSERAEPYGEQAEGGDTVLNLVGDIHEQVRQFVERELEYTCKVTSI